MAGVSPSSLPDPPASRRLRAAVRRSQKSPASIGWNSRNPATFAHEREAGEAKANARVAENLYRKATGEGREAVTAAIFWLKTRARWKEIHRDDDGNQPVIVQIQRFAEDL